MNLFPLCTASVWPTNSGEIVERRAHVLITRFSFARFIASSRWSSFATTYGPFLTERLISLLAPSRYPCLRRRTIIASESFRLRVFLPFASRPHGEHG